MCISPDLRKCTVDGNWVKNMSSTKEKLTKYTACYRCPDDISNFRVRINLKEVDPNSLDVKRSKELYSREFQWQEKCFSKTESMLYSDVLNCVTDLEKKYNKKFVEAEQNADKNSILFTYVDEDGYTDDQEIFNNKINYLQSMVENLDLVLEETSENITKEFDHNKSIIESIETKIIPKNFEKMYIMADFGEYVENIWIKDERPLCILKYDRNSKTLFVYPDFTTSKPYFIRILNGEEKYYQYFIEHVSENISETIAMKEESIIKQVNNSKQTLRKQIIGSKFFMPPKNKLYVYLFFEILSAKYFEYPDIYVQYHIDLPQYWTCKHPELLKGITQTGHAAKEEGLVHFGHCFDVVLEYEILNLQNGIPKTPYIYFEVFSKGSWDRYRTEGLTYKNLPISSPGCHFYNLSCFRFISQSPSGNLRRFFIGDCKNYKDLTWIGLPKDFEDRTVNKFGVNTVGTGQINVRLNVLHQSQAFLSEFSEGDNREKMIYEKLNSSSLIKSVEQVLLAFKRARRNMIAARKNVQKYV